MWKEFSKPYTTTKISITKGVIAIKMINVVIDMLKSLIKFRCKSYLKNGNLLHQQYVNAISYKRLLQ